MTRRLIVAITTTLAGSLGTGLAAQNRNPLVGDWMGTLELPTASLRLTLNVSMAQDGTGLTAVMVSPDQSSQEIPVDALTLDGPTVSLSVAALGMTFAGTLADDGESIDGTFTQMGNALPLVFNRTTGEIASPARPQDPKEPYPYHSEDVTYTNPDGGHTLAGTFTKPSEGGPFPAVILISGSGPQDRNESLLGHRPFLVLSDHLTRKGIAVLRFDDRGVGESTGDFSKATSQEFASDVLAGVDYLRTRADVAPERIGLAGHSEGGLIAPMVAARSNDVRYLVLMAGPGVNGERILYAQSALIAKAGGASEERVRESLEAARKTYAVLKSDVSDAEAAQAVETIIRGQMADASPEELAEGGITDANREGAVEAQVTAVTSPWFRYFLTYEPSQSLEKVHVPVLAINGENDLQVPHEENLREIGAALTRGGNDDFELHTLPGLNHLFQHSETGSPREYQKIEETWAPEALELISTWILKTVGTS